MSSSPKFWQKLGLGKQNKSLSASTTNSDNASIRSSMSFHNFQEDTHGKKMKRFSNLTLKHRASLTSLRQPITENNKQALLLKSRKDPELGVSDNEINTDADDKKSSIPIVSSDYNLRKLQQQQPTRKQSCIDFNQTKLPSPPRVMKKTKSNQSLKSTSSAGSRDQKTKKTETLLKRKSLPRIETSSDDESCLTRTSSNGSISERRHRKSLEKRKNKQVTEGGENFVLDMLRDELEREKAASRALQGQKEAIAKDLDYFCKLADEITEEKDDFKRKYEEEKHQHELLRAFNGIQSSGATTTSDQLRQELEDLKQRMVKEQYAYYSNLQDKDDEINNLKNDLRQTQRQLQILRKTMERLLRADGRDAEEASFLTESDDNKCLLLQASYHPNADSPQSLTATSPPSPTPCYTMSGTTEDDDDLLSTTSRDSYHSSRSHRLKLQYEFLKLENETELIAKRKSEDFSKKIAMSRRRKDQLEEMLGEVDSQLHRVKQKIRSPTTTS
ncbi:uncharacterized protein B0P05DRAFT_524339 [Gilbertella persicaria]|uniref:uncharacterized protein n=1 Tax=Gilbertella persicaria TaxID=101096 RepID=UPI00221F8DF0|nr:uncharacterized protein B0P05DRAFT_524339 [Gilbertella persicaria]KAI8095017.1 hypothetical protein B0P05DRAFT_524339 [Gilbertella persicaria]